MPSLLKPFVRLTRHRPGGTRGYPRRSRSACLLWLSLSLGLSVGAASASDSDWLDALDSPAYEKREQATESMLLDEAMTVDRVGELYALAETQEQRHRLLLVARHHFLVDIQDRLFAPPGPGAVGILHDTVRPGDVAGLETPAVHVLRTLPGFPAYARLRTDDLIVAFNDQPLPEAGFTSMVEGMNRGDPVELTLLRDGQRMTVQLELASSAALNGLFDAATLDLSQPFLEQWQTVYDEITDGHPAGNTDP